MTNSLLPLVFVVVVIVILYNSIRIAGESERFAVFVLGRFQPYKGPGLVIITPYTQQVHQKRCARTAVTASGNGAGL
jgi:regulator of protease activity HflC (stomatin/prohibitin superfamily)